MPQLIKKKKIVLASVLKPVDDPRMFDKLAGSFCDLDACEVFVMGYPGETSGSIYKNVRIMQSSRFKRISLSRLVQPLKLLFKIIKINPSHLIIGTHELLFIGTLSKMVTGSRLIYDIRENYFLNILHLTAFPWYLRFPIAHYVRLKEILLSPFVDFFILAEGCYQRQLKFLKNKFIVAENKLQRKFTSKNTHQKQNDNTGTILLFSGTLAESTGVFAAIKLTKELHRINSSVQLIITGYCAKNVTLDKIKKKIMHHDFIRLIGGDHLISHATIMSHIHSADYGIIAYPPNPATHDKFPTKLFEYLGTHLPIILTPNPLLESFCSHYGAAVKVNPDSLNGQALLSEMKSKDFYSRSPGDEILWEPEVTGLIKALNTI